jgi:hypothetical protein
MIKWLNIPESTKRNAYKQIAEDTGMSAFAVEKDWWVSRTLQIIFQMPIAKHLVFKGGTSLSKAWKLINRFSEDIDLAIDKEFFEGYEGILSKSKITKLRKDAGAYTTTSFFNELKEEFSRRGLTELYFKVIDAEESDQDPRIIEIFYPNIITPPTDYMMPRVQIEIGCRSLREPFSIKEFGSLVDEVYADRDFAEPLFQVPTVDPERTFLEKLFLLHEEFHKPGDKMRIDRLSRHLYDVFYLTKSGIAKNAIANKILYETIVSHRQKFSKVAGVDYNTHNPNTINPIPPTTIIDFWKADYSKMQQDMIYEKNKPSFDDLINNLSYLRTQLQTVEWSFELEFPIPNS